MSRKKISLTWALAALLAITTLVLATSFVVKTHEKDFSQDPFFFKALGNELVKQEEFVKATVAYEQSLLFAEDYEVRSNLAVLYYQQEKYSAAIEHLRILASYDQDNPSHHYDLAVNLVDRFRNTEDKSMDDLYEALSEYERADELMPGFSHSMENIEVLKRVLKIE